jgi:hypothetical protein
MEEPMTTKPNYSAMLEAICEATALVEPDFTPDEQRRADSVRRHVLARLAEVEVRRVPVIDDVTFTPATRIGAKIAAMTRGALIAALSALEGEHELQLAFRHNHTAPSDDDLRRLLATLTTKLDN